MLIRAVSPADVEQMLDIYAPFITENAVSFEIRVPSVDEFTLRVANYTRTHPWLIAEMNGRVIGYAYASPYRERQAYQWSAECSVYVHESHRKSGVATALYTALFNICGSMGFRNLYAIITLPNERSVSFHQKLGFEKVGVFKDVGFKMGRWHDVLWMHYKTGEPDTSRAPLLFSSLSEEEVRQMLSKS
jgi:phosphinothricin acetyltransferase